MVKCSECGFLAVWFRSQRTFEEASEQLRKSGFPDVTLNDQNVFHAKCFLQKYNLVSELDSNPKAGVARVFGYSSVVLEVIDTERKCDGYTPWMQGSHPKEHQEMLDKRSERRWRIAEGLIFAVSGAVAGSVIALASQWATKPEVPIVNISPPTVNVTTPPVSVTVQVPEKKANARATQSVPPTTTHDQKPPLP